LNAFTGMRPNQNVVLKCSKLDYMSLKRMSDLESAESKGKFYLFLD